MAADPVEPVRGRLANVSAVVFADETSSADAVEHLAKQLGDLFEDVRVVRRAAGESALESLVGALDAAREERVLVLDPSVPAPPAVWLGLCAWPEHSVVTPRIDGVLQPLCAVYLRDDAAPGARELAAAGEGEAAALLRELDTGVIEGEDLTPLLA